jgi:branched-chain amino acid transport system ATP-binding protein
VTTLFRAEKVSVRYGSFQAVADADLEFETGVVVGLIGPNGAGKTTLVDALSGFVKSAGSVYVDGQRIDHMRPHRRALRGVVRTFQSLELFDDMSVRDNLLVAAVQPPWWACARDVLGMRSQRRHDALVRDALELLGLSELAGARPSEVSLGERKRIAVARGLVGGPRVLMLDEPAAGLDSKESLELGAHLRQVAESGVSILLVDHDMGLVLGASDWIYVLSSGRMLASGPPSNIRADPRVIEVYLGSHASAPAELVTPAVTETQS